MLTKLASLKRWLTLEDAASHLSLIFNESVSERDLVQLALEGQLTLSVVFPNPIIVIQYEETPEEDLPASRLLGDSRENPEVFLKFLDLFSRMNWAFWEDGRCFEPNFTEDHQAAGLWDFPMIDRTINPLIVSKKMQSFISEIPLDQEEEYKPSQSQGTVLLQHTETKEYWGLTSYKQIPEDEDTADFRRRDFFNLHQSLPATASIVISQSNLRIFIDKLLASEQRFPQTIEDSERQNYPPRLETLTIAWRKFWKNADPGDRTACPRKPDVEAWLKEQGFSAKNADAGATIIKPQWAIDKGW